MKDILTMISGQRYRRVRRIWWISVVRYGKHRPDRKSEWSRRRIDRHRPSSVPDRALPVLPKRIVNPWAYCCRITRPDDPSTASFIAATRPLCPCEPRSSGYNRPIVQQIPLNEASPVSLKQKSAPVMRTRSPKHSPIMHYKSSG